MPSPQYPSVGLGLLSNLVAELHLLGDRVQNLLTTSLMLNVLSVAMLIVIPTFWVLQFEFGSMDH